MTPGPTTVEIFVHFDDGDPAGIMFFPNYFRLSERAFELGLLKNGIAWSEWFRHPDWGVPLRHVEGEFHRPLRPGQNCKVRQSTARIGNSSLTLKSEILDAEGHLCAVVHTTHVFVSRPDMKKRNIPDHLRKYLEAIR